jgi:hypothetical protein
MTTKIASTATAHRAHQRKQAYNRLQTEYKERNATHGNRTLDHESKIVMNVDLEDLPLAD